MDRKKIEQQALLILVTGVIFSIVLSACASAVTPVTSHQSGDVAILPTEKAIAIETATVVPTETEEIKQPTVEDIAIEAKKNGILPFLYDEQRKAFIDELNKIEDPTGRREQDHWVYVEIDPSTNKLNVLVNGDLVYIPGSENISPEQWQRIIDKDNIDEVVASGEFNLPDYKFDPVRKADRLIKDYKSNVMFVSILLPIPENGLIKPTTGNSGVSVGAIPELIIRFIKDEKGNLVPIGEAIYQFNTSIWGYIFLSEGGKKVGEVYHVDGFDDGSYKTKPNIKPYEVYYAITTSDPNSRLTTEGLDEEFFKQDIRQRKILREYIGEPDFTPIADSYEAIVNPDLTRSGVPILVSPNADCILIKTDGKW